MTTMTRRELLKASAATGLVLGAPVILAAQSKAPINIGTLCPLTGAGGSYGPDMQRSVVAVVERINKAGGILGRPVQLFHEDDQTSAEAGVRAARKLIDVNKVIAIVSTWASAVTLAVRPPCVEAQVFLIGVSGADAQNTSCTSGSRVSSDASRKHAPRSRPGMSATANPPWSCSRRWRPGGAIRTSSSRAAGRRVSRLRTGYRPGCGKYSSTSDRMGRGNIRPNAFARVHVPNPALAGAALAPARTCAAKYDPRS